MQFPGILLDWSDLTFNNDQRFFFLLPNEWDYYYTVYWVERKLDISKALSGFQRGSTFPAVVLKTNIVFDEDSESRTRFKIFKLDSLDEDMGEEDDEDITDSTEDFVAIYSRALLVEVTSSTMSVAGKLQQAELQARTICFLLVSREMFSTYKYPATRQIGATMYSNNPSPEHTRGPVTTFPSSQKRCIR